MGDGIYYNTGTSLLSHALLHKLFKRYGIKRKLNFKVSVLNIKLWLLYESHSIVSM